MKRTRATNSREKVLDAAEAVVVERGVNSMTLDAVAAQAEVSKGGLLYHFPSKDALLQAMISRIAEMAEQHYSAALEKESAGRGRHARALLTLFLNNDGSFLSRMKRLATPLIAAVAGHPEFLDPMRQFFRKVQKGMCDDGLPSERAWLILAALDGLKFWRILKVMEPSGDDLSRLRRLFEQLIENEDCP